MGLFQRKVTVQVQAEQLQGQLTAAGAVVANKGDWIITSGSGESFILSDEDFRKEYEPIPLQQ